MSLRNRKCLYSSPSAFSFPPSRKRNTNSRDPVTHTYNRRGRGRGWHPEHIPSSASWPRPLATMIDSLYLFAFIYIQTHARNCVMTVLMGLLIKRWRVCTVVFFCALFCVVLFSVLSFFLFVHVCLILFCFDAQWSHFHNVYIYSKWFSWDFLLLPKGIYIIPSQTTTKPSHSKAKRTIIPIVLTLFLTAMLNEQHFKTY